MRLVTVAHGTRDGSGSAVAAALTAAAGQRLGLPAVATYVELAAPLYADVIADGEPSVVVPLLLSTGFHIRHDLAGLPALGPDPLLAEAQAARLVEAGARPGTPVVMVAAGSSDPRAGHDLGVAAAHLAAAWGGPVRLATLAGLGRRPAEIVRPGVAVSPYLLAPGHFSRRCRAESLAAGASLVADVVGAHPAVVELVARRVGVGVVGPRSA